MELGLLIQNFDMIHLNTLKPHSTRFSKIKRGSEVHAPHEEVELVTFFHDG